MIKIIIWTQVHIAMNRSLSYSKCNSKHPQNDFNKEGDKYVASENV